MLALTVRIALGLLAIAALFLVVRLTRNARARGEPLAVLSRQQLTRGGTVALVRVADRGLVLGVTEQGINLLTETQLPPDHPPASTARAAAGALPEPDAPAEIPTRESLGDPDNLVFGHDPEGEEFDDSPTLASRLRSAIAGSALAPGTWRDAIDALRERTVRRPSDPARALDCHVRTVRRP
jgi:flagellar protein FliO/FliZ